MLKGLRPWRHSDAYVKGHFTGAPTWWSAMQTVLIGGVAAGVACGIARAIS